MIILKLIFILLGALIYILIGFMLNLILGISNSLRLKSISQWTRVFNKLLLSIFKVKVTIQGDRSLLGENGNFIISNHLSYLDGIILGSLFAVIYTSKSEVKSWPVFGWMTQVGGTIFIDRQRKGRVSDYVQEAKRALQKKVNVLSFPEGTSCDGQRLLPFQAIHFQSPILAEAAILPVTVIYTKVDKEEFSLKNRDKVCWYGQVKLFSHLLGILSMHGVEAKVILHPKVDLSHYAFDEGARKALSLSLHQVIASHYPLFKEQK